MSAVCNSLTVAANDEDDKGAESFSRIGEISATATNCEDEAAKTSDEEPDEEEEDAADTEDAADENGDEDAVDDDDALRERRRARIACSGREGPLTFRSPTSNTDSWLMPEAEDDEEDANKLPALGATVA